MHKKKNWLHFSFFVYIVNSLEVQLNESTIKYFELGHTFMSADSFHHQVELSVKHKGNVYNFSDFTLAASSNSGKIYVKLLQNQSFIDWTDQLSTFKINKTHPRAYLSNMSWIQFNRGSFNMKYSPDFATEFMDLNFLKAFVLKNGFNNIN